MLANYGYKNEIVFVKTEGDINLTQPLYEMGVQGIFTKTLDAALLDKRIDIAVHSYKDVPTKIAKGLEIAAVLKRGDPFDVLVCKNEDVLNGFKKMNISQFTIRHSAFTIATSSARRKAQWLNRFPNSIIENLRGNVNTRFEKINQLGWDGAIFAAAGLERLNIHPAHYIKLNWMLPAPAQGAIVVVCRMKDKKILKACQLLNDKETELCTSAEKCFLRTLMGGCSTPVGAYAYIKDNNIHFKGNVLSPDGTRKEVVEIIEPLYYHASLGTQAALQLLGRGGEEIMQTFKHPVDIHE